MYECILVEVNVFSSINVTLNTRHLISYLPLNWRFISSPVCSQCFQPSYLHSGLCQPDPQRQLLPHEDVWVVRFGEAPLQLVELCRGKTGPVSLLFLGLLRCGLVLVVVLLLMLLLLLLLLFAIDLHWVGSTAAADIIAREHRGSFHAVWARAELPGVSWIRSPSAEPALQSLPVAQELRRGILHPCTDSHIW